MSEATIQVSTSCEGKVTKVLQPGDVVILLRKVLRGLVTSETVMYPPYWDGSMQEGKVAGRGPIEVPRPNQNRLSVPVVGGFAGEAAPCCYLMNACWREGERPFVPADASTAGRWTRGVEVRYCCPSCMSLGLVATAMEHREVYTGTLLICEFCKGQIWTGHERVVIVPDPASEGETSYESSY